MNMCEVREHVMLMYTYLYTNKKLNMKKCKLRESVHLFENAHEKHVFDFIYMNMNIVENKYRLLIHNKLRYRRILTFCAGVVKI
jgi:hypothetical protein